MYVCRYVEHVCMYVEHVCSQTYIHAYIYIHTCLASEASEAPKSRYPAWTKKCVQTLDSAMVLKHSGLGFKNTLENALLEQSCSLFWSCVRGGYFGSSRHPKPFPLLEVFKTPHRERDFKKPLTGRGVLKNLSQGEEF